MKSTTASAIIPRGVRGALIPVAQKVAEEFGYPCLSESEIYGTARFRSKRPEKHAIRACPGSGASLRASDEFWSWWSVNSTFGPEVRTKCTKS